MKTKIKAKIAKLEKEIAQFDITVAQSQAAYDRVTEAFADIDTISHDTFKTDAFQKDLADMALVTKMGKVVALEYTLQVGLMHCPNKYVVTNTKQLESPAGFHPDENVFVQTKIAIHTDSLKGIPSSNVTLYVHEMRTA